MPTPSLLLDAALAVVLGGLFAYVGHLMGRRPVTSPEAAQARRAFALWWYGLAALTWTGGLRHLLGGLDVTHAGLHAALTYLGILPLVAALWGLLYYLLYVHTGRPGLRKPLLYAHVGLAAFFLGLVAWMRPTSVLVSDWSVRMGYERALTGPLLALVLLLLLAPVLLAAGAYLTLAFRIEDRTARLRILTVSGAFLLWFGSAALASVLGWSEWYWWPLAARGVSLVATLLVLVAYQRGFPWRAHPEVFAVLPARGRTKPREPRLLPALARRLARGRARVAG